MPQHAMRKLVYTAKPISAAELASYGSVAAVVPLGDLRSAALALAAEIAAKSPTIIRRAKESLNGIDPVDVKRSYRFEQGFTYELHVRGVADEQRAAFVEKRDADTSK
jgi:enoyl-CoA hydratase